MICISQLYLTNKKIERENTLLQTPKIGRGLLRGCPQSNRRMSLSQCQVHNSARCPRFGRLKGQICRPQSALRPIWSFDIHNSIARLE